MYSKKSRRKKKSHDRIDVQPSVWLPEAFRFGSLLQANGIRYAIFGAGALATNNIMVRPTIDVDFVVDDYPKAVGLLNVQTGIDRKQLEEDKDGIQVADFHFTSGVTVQIWDNNLYSLPMTDESWSHIMMRNVPGYGPVHSISIEDLIVSKVGRYTQQKSASQYEADKNIRDIVSAISVLKKPDINYAVSRLKEGARRELPSPASRIHPLTWYFVREAQVYGKAAEGLEEEKIGRVRKFIASILTTSKSRTIEYWLLTCLRKNYGGGDIKKFQQSFYLDDRSLEVLLKRWGQFLHIGGGKLTLTARDVESYLERLPVEKPSDYAKQLAYSGKRKL